MGFNVLDTLSKLATESGFAGFFAAGGWQNLVMIVVACVLLYLGIVKGFEPLLLVGIAFGCLLANVSYFPGLDAINPDLNATNALYHPELWSGLPRSGQPVLSQLRSHPVERRSAGHLLHRRQGWSVSVADFHGRRCNDRLWSADR